jgi:hypothetical protein
MSNIDSNCNRYSQSIKFSDSKNIGLTCFSPLLPLTMASPCEITLMGRKRKALRDPLDGFSEEVEKAWFNNGLYHNAAQDITAIFKNLRYALKKWSKNISKLSGIMDNCSYVLALLDVI